MFCVCRCAGAVQAGGGKGAFPPSPLPTDHRLPPPISPFALACFRLICIRGKGRRNIDGEEGSEKRM